MNINFVYNKEGDFTRFNIHKPIVRQKVKYDESVRTRILTFKVNNNLIRIIFDIPWSTLFPFKLSLTPEWHGWRHKS